MYCLVLVCIDCIACIVNVLLVWCIQTCIGVYWYVFACIDLYYASMDSMLVLQAMIHANTFQYISICTDTKYWIEILFQYLHACNDCINMYCFFQ